MGRGVTYCFRCGVLAADGEPPVCAEHGPLWELARNAPCADVVVKLGPDVLLGKRAIEPFKGYWSLPGGHQNFGEPPHLTATREAHEEFGIEVVIRGLVGIFMEEISDTDIRQITVYEGVTRDRVFTLNDEVESFGWFNYRLLPDETTPHTRKAVRQAFA